MVGHTRTLAAAAEDAGLGRVALAGRALVARVALAATVALAVALESLVHPPSTRGRAGLLVARLLLCAHI